jgi:hypothetical protein
MEFQLDVMRLLAFYHEYLLDLPHDFNRLDWHWRN